MSFPSNVTFVIHGPPNTQLQAAIEQGLGMALSREQRKRIAFITGVAGDPRSELVQAARELHDLVEQGRASNAIMPIEDESTLSEPVRVALDAANLRLGVALEAAAGVFAPSEAQAEYAARKTQLPPDLIRDVLRLAQTAPEDMTNG